MNASTEDYRFEVSLSFAGDNKRDKIREIADKLKARFPEGTIFFDEDFEYEFAGLNSVTYFQKVYRNESRLVIACVCSRYGEKESTRHEWRAIRSFVSEIDTLPNGRSRFLPIRFDDGEIDGIFTNIDHVLDVRTWSADEIADLILKRHGCCLNERPTERRIVIPGGNVSADVDPPLDALDPWLSFVVDKFLEEFYRLSTNTQSVICRALKFAFSGDKNRIHAGVTQFFRTHSNSATQDSDAVSGALDTIDSLIERADNKTQTGLMNMQDWLMTTLVYPIDNMDIAIIRDRCDGVMFVGHPAGAELLFCVADQRKPSFILTDDGEVVGKHLLNLSSPPIGDQDPLVLVKYHLTEIADRVGAVTFDSTLIDQNDHKKCIQFWAEQLSLIFEIQRQRTGSRFYCCCPLPADERISARMISLLREVSGQIPDLGVFRLRTNRETKSAEDIIVPLLRKRFERL